MSGLKEWLLLAAIVLMSIAMLMLEDQIRSNSQEITKLRKIITATDSNCGKVNKTVEGIMLSESVRRMGGNK